MDKVSTCEVLTADRFIVTLPDRELSERVASFSAGLLSTRFELSVLEFEDGHTAELLLSRVGQDVPIKVEVLSREGKVIYTPVDSRMRIEDILLHLDCEKVRPLFYTVVLRGVAKS